MLLITLLIATISDIATMTVPPLLWLLPFASKTVLFLWQGKSLQEALLCSALVFLIFSVLSVCSDFGGADVLAFSSVAFVLEWNGFLVILLSFLLVIPYLLLQMIKKRRKPYPFIPFIFFAFLIYLIFSIVEV